MASKSTGQIIGTVAGAVIGFFTGGAGYVALGAALGGMAGGLIDPPKGPTVVGPRLDDLSFQTSTLGAPLGRAYGTVPVLGNVVWLEGDKYLEVITTEEQGGKGGGGATYETAHYYATFAVSLLRVTDATKALALRRMWIGSNLVYDAGSDDLESIIASNSQSALFTFYSGTDDQQPNTRWQADKGANAVSGFPGRCYIVIYDLDLEPYSRSLAMAQVKCELAVSNETITTEIVETIFTGNLGDPTWGNSIILLGVEFDSAGADYVTYEKNNWAGNPLLLNFGRMEFPYSEETFSFDITAPEGGYGYAHGFLYCCQSDESVSLQKQVQFNGYSNIIFRWFYSDGSSSRWYSYVDDPRITYGDHACFVYDRGETFVAGDNLTAYIVKIDNVGYVNAASAVEYSVRRFGASENYIFALLYTPGADNLTTTVYKLDRETLSLVDTYTQDAVGGRGTIHVVSDDLFYTAAFKSGYGGHIYKWVDGVVVEDYGNIFPDGIGSYSRLHVVSDAPFYGYLLNYSGSYGIQNIFVFYPQVAASVAYLRDIITEECSLAGISSGEVDLSGLTNSEVRGYRIANLASIRSSLEMLQAAYPFDVAPSGYKLRFLSRGGASQATISETDLGATDGGDKLPVLLPVTREMDTQIPYKVSVRYLDPAREYDIAEQYASRPDTASVNERTVELSLVLTGDEAAQVSDVLNQKDWLERVSFGTFTLPPTYRAIEPPDVVTVEHRGQSHTLRLTRAEFLPDGRIECSGVYSTAQAYTSTASAQDALTIGQSLVPLAGSTQGYLLDIPRIRSEQDVPGIAFGLTGLASGWPGGVLLRSDDSGNTWPVVGAMNARAKVFVATESIAGHHGYSIDHGSVLTVTPRYSAHTLSSVTEDQFYAHANLAAYGADGRWEIVAFRTVTDNTGSYTLNGFLRGLYGTEWSSGLHIAGDMLILLDTTTVGFFGLPINALGSLRLYRSATQGASIDSAKDVADTYDAVNLKPLSPVDLRGSRNPLTLDWSLSSARRTRSATELFSGASVPLGESSETYQIEIFSAGYSTVKRTFSGLTSLDVEYTSSEQVEDFGANQETLYVEARQVSGMVGLGYALRESIYRYLPLDPFSDQVVLLQSMNDTGLSDVRGHTVTLVGGVSRSATYSQEGGYSANFNGTSGYYYLNGAADLALGTGDFTVEGFIRPSSISLDMALFDFRPYNTNGAYPLIYLSSAGQIVYYVSSAAVISGSHGLLTTEFAHYALVRLGGVSKIYVKGVQVGSSYTDSNNYSISSGRPVFGVATYNMASSFFSGYADQQRITKAARYSGTFTPPTSFPNP
jgi:hypothetical protein